MNTWVRHLPFDERFASYTKRSDHTGCLLWTGWRDKNGYGRVRWSGRRQPAHRAAWIRAHGTIPDGLLVCHRCDVPACVEVSHLFLGTPRENTHDAMRKGRLVVGERSPRARITAADAAAIRRAYMPGLVSRQELASKYGLSRAAIGDIAKRRSWGSV